MTVTFSTDLGHPLTRCANCLRVSHLLSIQRLAVFLDSANGKSRRVLVREQDLDHVELEDNELLCVSCSQAITSERQRTAITGKHVHSFSNPEGVDYEIGCFSNATGVQGFGEATEEWTWFPAYSWTIVCCAGCATHLGWCYQNSSGNSFYGLILSCLKSAREN